MVALMRAPVLQQGAARSVGGRGAIVAHRICTAPDAQCERIRAVPNQCRSNTDGTEEVNEARTDLAQLDRSIYLQARYGGLKAELTEAAGIANLWAAVRARGRKPVRDMC